MEAFKQIAEDLDQNIQELAKRVDSHTLNKILHEIVALLSNINTTPKNY